MFFTQIKRCTSRTWGKIIVTRYKYKISVNSLAPCPRYILRGFVLNFAVIQVLSEFETSSCLVHLIHDIDKLFQ